ncbi:MAG: EamA family transporter [Clostridia bacterium]
MWVVMALLSALFAGMTAILSKMGIRNTDSTVATAIRTTVVLVFAWLMVFVGGLQSQIVNISPRAYLFLGLSGLCTGASWLCYFHALKLGTVNQVTPVDKSSTVLTMILAFFILGEPIGWLKLAAMALIVAGTLLMIEKKPEQNGAVKPAKRTWLIYALFSAVFAALTAVLGKIGIENVPSDLGMAMRTIVVLAMAWVMVLVSGKQGEMRHIKKRDMYFILLSGVATGLSWLCYYRALHDGQASVVVPLDKLSIVVTILFSRVFLKERLSKKALLGFGLLIAGTCTLLI